MNKSMITNDTDKTMDNVFDMSSYAQVKIIANDLANSNASAYAKDVLAKKLLECLQQHSSTINKMMAKIDEMNAKVQAYKDCIEKPQRLENEFEDVAKKLNFPIVPTTTDGVGFKNPNIEMPFEDPVPKKDIDFIKKHLQEKDPDKVVLPKNEVIPEEEMKTYKTIASTLNEDANANKDNSGKSTLEDTSSTAIRVNSKNKKNKRRNVQKSK